MLSPSLLWCAPVAVFAFVFWNNDLVITATVPYMILSAVLFWCVTVPASFLLSFLFDAPYSSVRNDCLRACHHAAIAVASCRFLFVPFLWADEHTLVTTTVYATQAYALWGYFWFCFIDCVALRGAGTLKNLLYTVHHCVTAALIAWSVYTQVEISGLIIVGIMSGTSSTLSLRTVARASGARRSVATFLDVVFVVMWFGVRMPALAMWTWILYERSHEALYCFVVLLALNIFWSVMVVRGVVGLLVQGRPRGQLVKNSVLEEQVRQQHELPEACIHIKTKVV